MLAVAAALDRMTTELEQLSGEPFIVGAGRSALNSYRTETSGGSAPGDGGFVNPGPQLLR